MAFKTKKQSLAEKISSLVTVGPTIFGSVDENEETKARVVERYDESESEEDAVGSAFRKRNVDLLDQLDSRYKGKKVSRKDVFGEENESDASDLEEAEVKYDNNDIDDDDDDDDDDNSDNSSAPEASDDATSEFDNSADDKELGSEAEESNSEEHDDSEIDEDNPLRRERREDRNFKNMTETNVRAEVEKGNCVREQLKIWENLLEMRIKLQKCLITSNKMPQLETYKSLKSDDNFKKESNDSTKKLSGLLDNLLDLQNSLLSNYPETKSLRGKGIKRKAGESEKVANEDPMDEEIPSDTDDEMKQEDEDAEESSENEAEGQPEKKKKRNLAEYEKILAENHNIYRDYRNSVIQKWNDKTRVATGSVNKGSSQAVVKQIEFVLSDKSKLLKRTQLKRSEYDVVGKVATEDEDGRRIQEYDTEIYDDDDFYHQLLRELIEYKSSDITDPIQLSKQWIQLQNMRNKMKRKIDTRATKGRRVRYNVHTKLVNFMAPVNTDDRWSDLAKNELYNSLFGKIKTSENVATTREETSEKS